MNAPCRSYRPIALIGFLMLVPGVSAAADLEPIRNSTGTMRHCTNIAQSIMTEKVPTAHAQYLLTKRSFAKETDPTRRPPSDPIQEAFISFIEPKALEFEACGRHHKALIGPVKAAMQKLYQSSEINGPTSEQIVSVIKQHVEAEQQLAQTMVALIDDAQRAAYVEKALVDYFRAKQ